MGTFLDSSSTPALQRCRAALLFLNTYPIIMYEAHPHINIVTKKLAGLKFYSCSTALLLLFLNVHPIYFHEVNPHIIMPFHIILPSNLWS